MSASTTPVHLPFVASSGVPQSVPIDLGGRRFTVTLLASAADLPALRSVDATAALVDAAAEASARPVRVPDDARSWCRQPAHSSLAPAVVRPTVVVREGAKTVGSHPVVAGRPLRFGATGTSPLAVEITFHELRLTAGALIRPGDTGSVITASVVLRTTGITRHEEAATAEEDPYEHLS